MKIQLKDWKVQNLTFKKQKLNRPRNHFNMSIGHTLLNDNNKCFVIAFQLGINDEEFKIKLEMLFTFETDNILDDDFMKSDFIKINAPAIAFPYIRSFISNLTLQSGFSPIILPSVNFVQLAQKKEEKEGD